MKSINIFLILIIFTLIKYIKEKNNTVEQYTPAPYKEKAVEDAQPMDLFKKRDCNTIEDCGNYIYKSEDKLKQIKVNCVNNVCTSLEKGNSCYMGNTYPNFNIGKYKTVDCKDGFYCNADETNNIGECQSLKNIGESCVRVGLRPDGISSVDNCKNNLFCNQNNECEKLKIIGQGCSLNQYQGITFDNCENNSYCDRDTNICVKRDKKLGDKCKKFDPIFHPHGFSVNNNCSIINGIDPQGFHYCNKNKLCSKPYPSGSISSKECGEDIVCIDEQQECTPFFFSNKKFDEGKKEYITDNKKLMKNRCMHIIVDGKYMERYDGNGSLGELSEISEDYCTTNFNADKCIDYINYNYNKGNITEEEINNNLKFLDNDNLEKIKKVIKKYNTRTEYEKKIFKLFKETPEAKNCTSDYWKSDLQELYDYDRL